MREIERAQTRDILMKRVKRLLEFDRSGPTELTEKVIPFLESLGAVALIGGAIRDVARAGKRGFSSDYDFVIYGSSRSCFAEVMQSRGGVRNRFGGYALSNFSVKVDVWHIEDTWAHTAGHKTVSMPEHLLQCTFFDWDSVVYDITESRLFLPTDYFERLRLNIMDIRLEENPNPLGSLVRALRRASLWHVGFGKRLTAFCKRLLEEYPWENVVELDRRAFSKPILYRLDHQCLLENLTRVDKSSVGEVTWPVPPEQLLLPIGSEEHMMNLWRPTRSVRKIQIGRSRTQLSLPISDDENTALVGGRSLTRGEQSDSF